MSLGFRVTAIVLALFGFAFFVFSTSVSDDLRYRYLEGVEESLVDQAHLVAEVVGREMKRAGGDQEALRVSLSELFGRLSQRRFDAHIYKYRKIQVDTSFYVTDSQGIVLFDSHFSKNRGKNFRLKRDVAKTLRGYGARFVRTAHRSDHSSVLYIAAPIMENGEIIGVVSVRKPTTGIDLFLRSSRAQLKWFFLIMSLFVTLSVLLSVFLLTRPLSRLREYALRVRDGENPALPRTMDREMRALGESLAEMREALEGKQYVEHYVTGLTHELKSPVAAIQSTAELLTEELPPKKRAQFMRNLLNDAARIGELTERMLELAKIEKRAALESPEPIEVNDLLGEVVEQAHSLGAKRGISLRLFVQDAVQIMGDRLLLSKLFLNLLKNAVEFSPENGVVSITCERSGDQVVVTIEDQGEGIPDYALPRLFERFYSLKRPATGQRSSGVGLNFALTIAKLHKGALTIQNGSPKGAVAKVFLQAE